MNPISAVDMYPASTHHSERSMRFFLYRPVSVMSLLCSLLFSGNLAGQNLDSLAIQSFDFAKSQLFNTIQEVGNPALFPRSTLSDGTWLTKSSSSWTSGFFPGCLWHIYAYTADSAWQDWARAWTAGLVDEQYNTGTHDVGFMIFCSYGNGYRLTGEAAYRPVILRAAQSLATRYNPTVGCIRSWNNRTFPVIIDNMMNLELLFWASKNGGEAAWYNIAVSHGLRTMEDHVRADGSTYQIVDYNPDSGIIIQKETSQGYQTESTWARGQSWGLYGFTMTYRETGDARFLETAQKLANYVIDHLPDDHVPYWDYEAPDIPNEEKDASAAAIAASGLLELSTLVGVDSLENKYRSAAEEILAALMSASYLAMGSNSRGILLHGVGNHNSGGEVDVSLIYSDYYFLEALLRYQAITGTNLALYDKRDPLPYGFHISQNYPNPFNAHTTIPFILSKPSQVTFELVDLTGRMVRAVDAGHFTPGSHLFQFNTDQLSSGIYLVRIRVGSGSKSIKITLQK